MNRLRNLIQKKNSQRVQRRGRVRARVSGTAQRPRLCVFRSLKHISAQLINDQTGRTLAAATDRELKKTTAGVVAARQVGELLAQKAQALKISRAVFDRSGYRYHGQVQALADGAREKGLQF